MSVTLPSRLETERLILRETSRDDADAVNAYAADPDVTRFLSFATHTDRPEAVAYLALCDENRAGGRSNAYMIQRRAGGDIVGVLDLRLETPYRLGFGYALARNYWGQEYMPEALTAAVAWGRAQPDIWRIWAFCDVENPASARTMEKAGLTFEGVLRRWFIHPNVGPSPRDCRAYAWARA
jgi:RimJ/RimL family protein N-acetyltransferase